jgi:DNA mismatch repair protein MutS2
MDDRSLKVLEFYHLLEILKSFSTSPLGRKHCEALRPSTDLTLIQSRLTEVMELKEILETLGDIPIRGLKDIEGILRKLDVEGNSSISITKSHCAKGSGDSFLSWRM